MNIKQTRKEMKLSTAEFGELAGVGARTVESWEQGRRKPSKAAQMLLNKLVKKGK